MHAEGKQPVVNAAAEQRRHGVHTLAQHLRHLVYHHVTQHTAADAGAHAEHQYEQHIVALLHCGVHAGHGEHRKTDGIEHIVDAVELVPVLPVLFPANVSVRKDDERCDRSHGKVHIAHEHLRRSNAEQKVPYYAAAECGDERKEYNAEYVCFMLKRRHCARHGKRRRTYNFKCIYQFVHHTLNLNSVTSPSFITYSLPSDRKSPFSFAAAMLPQLLRSSKATISALIKPRSKSLCILPAA